MGPRQLWLLSCRAYRMRLSVVARFIKALIFLIYKAALPFEAEIQPDIELDHYALGVVIHPNTTIGCRVRIYHNVTLAAESPIGSPHRITLGDDVTIGTGAIVIARTNCNLTIGNGAYVGAGAVVTRDVAPGQIVVGPAARPLERKAEQTGA